MIVKRIVSAVTGVAMLASVTVLSGCGSMKEFFTGESDSDKSAETNNTASAMDDGVITNGEWLAMVNDAFGMQVDESSENGEVEAAKEWGVIGENDNVDLNAPVDDKFVTSTLMRASGYADLDSSDEDIIQAAIQHGVISNPSDSISSPQQAIESLSTAQHDWSNKTFEEHSEIKFADNVTDLTTTINSADVDIAGDSLVIPAEYASSLSEEAVVILPKESANGKGGAYKISGIKDNLDGTYQLKAAPAALEDVYEKVHVSGKFGVDSDSIEPAEGVAYDIIESDAAIEPLSDVFGATIMPLGSEIQPMKNSGASIGIDGVSFSKKIGDFTVKAEVKNISLNANVDWEYRPFKLKVNNIYMGLNYTTEVSATTEFSIEGETDLFDLSKNLSEPSLSLGKLSIKICPGLSVNLKASLSFDASGELKVVVTVDNVKGFEMSGGNVRAINETSASSELSLSGHVGAYINLTLALSLDYLVGDVELLSVSLKVGPTIEAELIARSNSDVVCAQIDGWLTIEVTVAFLEPILKIFDIDSTMKIVEIGKDNSPVKFDMHLENFKVVPSCTVEEEATTEAPTQENIPTGIFALEKSYISVDVGSSSSIKIKSIPSGYSASDIVWESSNPSVVSVDANGNVSAVSAGTVSVTVKTKDGKYTASCAVNAKENIVVSNNTEYRSESGFMAA